MVAGKERESKIESENDSEFPLMVLECILEGIGEVESDIFIQNKFSDCIITASIFGFNNSTLAIIPIKFTKHRSGLEISRSNYYAIRKRISHARDLYYESRLLQSINPGYCDEYFLTRGELKATQSIKCQMDKRQNS